MIKSDVSFLRVISSLIQIFDSHLYYKSSHTLQNIYKMNNLKHFPRCSFIGYFNYIDVPNHYPMFKSELSFLCVISSLIHIFSLHLYYKSSHILQNTYKMNNLNCVPRSTFIAYLNYIDTPNQYRILKSDLSFLRVISNLIKSFNSLLFCKSSHILQKYEIYNSQLCIFYYCNIILAKRLS